MKAFKKIIALVLVFCMCASVLALTSCGGDNDNSTDNNNTTNNTTNNDNKKSYTITVVDGDNNPVSGVQLTVNHKDNGKEAFAPLTTDTNGKATIASESDYIKVMITKAEGYVKPAATIDNLYHGQCANGSTELKLTVTKVVSEKVAHSVTVIDNEGNPIANVSLQMCPDGKCIPTATNAEGKAVLEFTPADKVAVKILSAEGYILPIADGDGYHAYMTNGTTEITITLTKN